MKLRNILALPTGSTVPPTSSSEPTLPFPLDKAERTAGGAAGALGASALDAPSLDAARGGEACGGSPSAAASPEDDREQEREGAAVAGAAGAAIEAASAAAAVMADPARVATNLASCRAGKSIAARNDEDLTQRRPLAHHFWGRREESST